MNISIHTSIPSFLRCAPVNTTVYKPRGYVSFNTSSDKVASDAALLLSSKHYAYDVKKINGLWYFSASLRTSH